MKSVVSKKGQITIPKSLRERLGIHLGQVLKFTEEQGRWFAVKVTQVDAIEAVYEILNLPMGTDRTMVGLRGRGIPDYQGN